MRKIITLYFGIFGHNVLFRVIFPAAFLAFFAQASVSAQGIEPLVFLGDRDLPPYEFVQNGQEKGANVDLAKAIGRVLGRPVEIRLMEWSEAQAKLRAGEGHALTMLGRMPEREKDFAFSQQTFPVTFSLFVRADELPAFRLGSLSGKRVGVTSGGLPRTLFQASPAEATTLVIVENGVDGTKKLLQREIDAFAGNTWAQLYLLNELNITKVGALPPFAERKGNIAVRKGDIALLAQIDGALTQIKASGEFERIIDNWSGSRIHLFTDHAFRALAIVIAAGILALLALSIAFIWSRKQKAALGREINERSRIEAELRDNQNRLDLALDVADIGMFEWQIASGEVIATPQYCRIFGFDPSTLILSYDDVLNRIHPDDVAIYEETLNTAKLLKGPYQNIFRIVRPDGRITYVCSRGRFLHGTDGTLTSMLGVSIDVTQIEEAQLEIARRERQFTTLVENSPDILVRFDMELRYSYVSPIIERHTGLKAEHFIGKTIAELGMPPDLCEYWAHELREAIRTKQNRETSFDFTSPNNELLHYQARIVPEFGPDGAVESLLIINTDVTSRQKMIQALRESEMQLQEADRRKDEFLATLAHELRNPLAPIENALQIMRLSPQREVRDQARTVVERQLQQLIHLVDDLLEVSRITQGKIELRKNIVDLGSVVQNAIDTSRSLIDEAQHELTVVLPLMPIFIDADMTRLTQVFANLLNNACKFTPRGGRIWLVAECHHNKVEVTVKDNGIGIPANKLSSVFDMFSQVERAVDLSQGGLGIGLALVRQLVKLHGGTVEARSEGVNNGTEISVCLPLATLPPVEMPEKAQQLPPSVTEQHTGERHTRILVVDDNIDSAMTLQSLLEILGHEVTSAHDGRQALKQAESFRPDILFLDLGLPDLSGYEVAQQLREERWGKDMFLIALTGWGQAEDRVRSRAAGFDYHLVKPVRLDKMQELIAEWDARHHMPK